MSNLYKFFSMCLCVITVGAVLCCSGNKVFANITLSEDPGQVVGYRTMVVKFDDKSDITKMNMALHDVFESIKKHSGNAMCPYDTLRMMFVHSFENATANTCFLGNPGAMISKICGIFTDILFHGSATSECCSLKIISLNYKKVSERVEEYIVKVLSEAHARNASELRIVYNAEAGYELII